VFGGADFILLGKTEPRGRNENRPKTTGAYQVFKNSFKKISKGILREHRSVLNGFNWDILNGLRERYKEEIERVRFVPSRRFQEQSIKFNDLI
jgi:hypothetical protein